MRVSTLTSLGLFALPLPALAQSAALEWNAPRGCPSRDAVLEHARAAGLSRDAAEWSAISTVRHAPGGRWRLAMVIRVHGVEVPREGDATTCAALAELAGFDLALAVNTYADEAAPPPPPPPPPPPLFERVRVAEPRRPPRASSPLVARRWRVLVGVHAATDVGLLPSGNLGGGASVGVLWSSSRVELSGAGFYDVPTRAANSAFGARPEGAALLTLVELSARGCGRLTWNTWGLDGCLGIEGNWLVAAPSQRSQWWIAPLVGVDLSWRPIPILLVSAGPQLSVLTLRPNVTITNVGSVLETSWVHAVIRVAVSLAL